ncbi:uncharacterized protein LOC134767205 [Penaeus indicus]|uniref:uncharacterized protein LOC134767205 n=1 Tax=Penaeus indicus TaxID=29960 RepID=UPI00300C14EC
MATVIKSLTTPYVYLLADADPCYLPTSYYCRSASLPTLTPSHRYQVFFAPCLPYYFVLTTHVCATLLTKSLTICSHTLRRHKSGSSTSPRLHEPSSAQPWSRHSTQHHQYFLATIKTSEDD